MKKYLSFLLVLTSLFCCARSYALGGITPTDLKTEWMVNPLGVDVLKPGLSWVLTSSERGQTQLGYQILVASTEANLAADNGNVWNSGHIKSGEQTNIIYKGPALNSDMRYYWKVKVWDKNNIASDWSAMASWEMGLLKSTDWQGKWIGTSKEKESPLFRKDFTIIKTVKKATAHAYGLGWYEMHLNGTKVGDQVLTPANTDYTKRLLYDSYDVTKYLKEGGNTVGFWLSNGYGTNYSKYGWRWMDSKRAVLQMNIEFTDGSKMSVITDETWTADDSQISSAEIYNGETYDATKEKTGWDVNGYNDNSWENVVITSAPPGKMQSNMSTPVRVAKIINPVSVKQTASGSYIFDLGQNIAGWVRLHISGATRGVKIVMHHAEAEKSDGTLDTFTNRSARATDTYICKGGISEETYEPRFTYHGFRYVEVTGYPGTPSLSSLEGCSLHSDVEFTGSFSCSDSLINQIHSNFQWTILNNMVSIPTDNPVRDERTPCQMDQNCIYEAAIQNFDVQQYFKNWLGNIFESTSNPDWSSGQVLGPWLLYQYYGDKRILETFYSSSKKEVDFCLANAVKSNYWSDSFGDWCPPNTDGSYKNSFSEGEIVNTTLYYYITNLMSRIAGILGKTQDSTYYASKASSIMTTFNGKHFNSSANKYGSGKQITYIMPLMCGIVPANKQTPVFDKLLGNITGECSGHFGTGIYGTSFLPDLLCDNGRADVALCVLTQTTYPGFGYQIKNFGATTTWEQWGVPLSGGEMETFDHAMYSGADKTFYTRFGGIRPMTPGYKTISIKPCIPDSLDFVKSSVKTVRGLITSNWDKSAGMYTHFITIPVNTTAIVQIPGNDPGKVYENGIAASKAKGVYYLRTDKNYVEYKVVSGSYFFSYGKPVKPEMINEQKTMDELSQNKNPWPIITRKGDHLMEGEKVFRFFGLDAPNIQQNESQIRTDRTNRFPDDFEIRDILGGLQRIGGRATRTFTLSVYSPDDKEMPVYISARRTYNEEAFRCLDRVIALCHEYDVRLIIPFIASQRFGGIRGVDEFSELSGKPNGSFWTDEEVKADFRHFLDFILNRRNTINGIVYKDDPAILCWQLGNEFSSYTGDRHLNYQEWSKHILDWSLEMAAYIKKTDPNHLVMEANGADRDAFINDPNIDIISEHLYEYWNRLGGMPWDLAPIAKASSLQCKGKKPLIIDEFGLGNTENLRSLMKTIREENIVGGLMWSIRGHRRDGGWYYHSEGEANVNSFHIPGFSDGYKYDEKRLLDLLKIEAYQIRGLAIPEEKKPDFPPVLISKGKGFTWRGSIGAAYYVMERAESINGPWKIIATGLDDSVIADVSNFEGTPEASEPLILYYDETRGSGKTYYYRLKGENTGGSTAYSNILKSETIEK